MDQTGLAKGCVRRSVPGRELKGEVQESVFALLACQQPVAGDLRALVTASRMSVDLERMGDLAVHLAKAARRRHPEPVVASELRSTFVEMAEVADLLVAKAGRVIASRDIGTAMQLDSDDDRMDLLHRRVLEVVLSGQWVHGVETAVDVTLVARYFERFADHAVQLAGEVMYLVTGQRPRRHHRRLTGPAQPHAVVNRLASNGTIPETGTGAYRLAQTRDLGPRPGRADRQLTPAPLTFNPEVAYRGPQ